MPLPFRGIPYNPFAVQDPQGGNEPDASNWFRTAPRRAWEGFTGSLGQAATDTLGAFTGSALPPGPGTVLGNPGGPLANIWGMGQTIQGLVPQISPMYAAAMDTPNARAAARRTAQTGPAAQGGASAAPNWWQTAATAASATPRAQPAGPDASRVMNYQARAAGFQTVPASVQTLGQASDFAQQVNRAGVPSSAMGTYQIVGQTMRGYAPRVFGQNWRSQPFNQESQDRLGRAIFEDNRGSAAALRGQWVGLTAQDAEQIRHLPWEQARSVIAARESGGSSPGPFGVGQPPGMEQYDQRLGAAITEMERARDTALQPVQLTTPYTPPADVPAPTPFEQPSFAEGDAAFAAARPKAPFAEPGSETRYLRQNFFRGMAQALLQVQPGRPIGFGELLMRAGMGAMGGRMEGHERVETLNRQHERDIGQYNMQLANREDQQATITAQTVNRNIEQRNQHATQQHGQNFQLWARNNPAPQVVGNNLYTSRVENGQTVTNIIPIRPMVEAEHQMRVAQALLGSAGGAQQNAQWGYQMAYTQARELAAIAAAQGGATGDDAVAFGLISTISPAVDSGRWRQWVEPELANQLEQEGFAQLGIEPSRWRMDPAYQRQFADQYRNWLIERITVEALSRPAWGARIFNTYGGRAAQARERYESTRRSTSTSRTGTRTNTTYAPGD